MVRARTTWVVLAAVALALAAPACSGDSTEERVPGRLSAQQAVRGSGQARSEQRSIGMFDRLMVRSRAEVRVRFGDAPSLTITTDGNLLPLITTSVDEAALVITSPQPYTTSIGVNVEVVTRSLEAVEFDASGEVLVEGLEAPGLEVTIRGGGRVAASGSTEELKLDASSSATAELFDLRARRVMVTLRDTAVAEVTALEALDAHIGGSGSVVFDGDPVTLNLSSDATATGAVRPRYPPPMA